MRSEAAAARDIQAFIDKLAGDLDPPADGSPWKAFADWAKDLLDSYLAIDVNGSDDDAMERIRRLLDDFAVADSMNDDATLAAFRRMVAELMQTPFGFWVPPGRACSCPPSPAPPA